MYGRTAYFPHIGNVPDVRKACRPATSSLPKIPAIGKIPKSAARLKLHRTGAVVLFHVLGPLVVEDAAGRDVDIGSGKLSHLLALFLLNANSRVSKHWIIEHLWRHNVPRSATSNLKTYVTTLRRLQVPIATHKDGYLLTVAPNELDADLFEHFAATGREALERRDLYNAAAALESATGLWRGDPLHGVDLDVELSLWTERLREGFQTVTEDFFEVRLALGRHREIIGPLKIWTVRHPLRERAHAQLMTALYRDGRQAEALDVYQSFRTNLVAQIGLEPTPVLRDMQRRILQEEDRFRIDPVVHMLMEKARVAILHTDSAGSYDAGAWSSVQ
ncbi:hypothetical protein GCM10009677_27060 [Sphaerisporangium rubeum]